jgi:peptidoglycan/xylan/chitin deacetylase (PgdA/CDA1 family)
LAQEGFAFGSHGMTHTPFTQLSTTALKSELIESKARLEELLGQVVVDLALPLGRYNHSIIQVALDVGYERIMTSNIGLARLGYSPIYSRIPIFCNTTLATFRMLMAAGPFQLRMLRLWRSLSRRVSPLLSRPRWHTIASGNAH